MKIRVFMTALLMAVPMTAMADDDCTVDADCPYGFQCEEVTLPCATAPDCPPCPCLCPPEGECPPCQCDPCPEPEPCETKTVKMCRYDPVECTKDDDCEAGFECVEVESCQGSGCACSACACPTCPPDGECPPCDCPEVIECDCNPDDFQEQCEVDGAWCMPAQQACEDVSDCPDGWECEAIPVPCGCAPCVCTGMVCPADDDCPEVPECDCPPCECDDPGDKACLPGGWSGAGYQGSESSPDSAFASLGGSQNDGTGSPQDPTSPDPEEKAAAGDGGDIGCTAGPRPMSGLPWLFLTWVVAALVLRTRYGRR